MKLTYDQVLALKALAPADLYLSSACMIDGPGNTRHHVDGRTRASLYRRGLIKTFEAGWVITDAGRAALKGAKG